MPPPPAGVAAEKAAQQYPVLDGWGALSYALATRSYLVHLDVSSNHLDADMVAQFASRLRDNQTLLGLHVWGNAAALDSHGYVVPVGGGYADRALAHVQGARGGGGGGARVDRPCQ